MLLIVYLTSILAFFHNNNPVLFIWFRGNYPISSFGGETQLIPANQRNRIHLSMNALGMSIWSNCGLGESCWRLQGKLFLVLKWAGQVLLLSRDVNKEGCFLPVASGCHLTSKGSQIQDKANRWKRAETHREMEPWIYHELNLSTSGFPAEWFPTVFRHNIHHRGCLHPGHISRGVPIVSLCVIPEILEITWTLSLQLKKA